MAGNSELRARLHHHFGEQMKYSGRIGLTHRASSPDEPPLPGAKPTWFFAPDQIRKRAKEWGPGGIEKRFGAAWAGFAPNLESGSRWSRAAGLQGRAAGLSRYALGTYSAGSGPYALASWVKRFLTARKAYSVGSQSGRAQTAVRKRSHARQDRRHRARRTRLALAFEAALAARDDALDRLFHADSYWRDVLALSWNLQTINGAPAILAELKRLSPRAAVRNFLIDPDRAAPRRVTRAGTSAIEAIFKFETELGRGHGILRLTPDEGDGNRLKAWTLLTALEELKGFEEQLERTRPRGQAYSRDFRGPNWLDLRQGRDAPMPTAIRPYSWSAAARPGLRSPRG